MSFAIIMLLLAALPVIYYYLAMYQIYEKLSDIFGIIAGLWLFFGIFAIYFGIVGFSFFIIFFLIIIIGFIFQFTIKYLPGIVEDIIEKAKELLDNAPEMNVHEKIIEKVPSLQKSSKRLGVAIICFGITILLYLSFFTVPVSPADSNETLQFNRHEGNFKNFPNAYRIDYINGKAIVVIVTLRTIPISPDMYSKRLRDEVKETTEKKAKEEYGADIRVEYQGEESEEVNGHDAIKQQYYIYGKESNGLFNGEKEKKVAEMYVLAWFCNKDFETVVVGYVYPPGLKISTENLIYSINCH